MNSEVHIGNNEQLFLVGSVHNVLKHMNGEIPIPEPSKVNFYHNLVNRRNYCESRGIKYIHVIYPDKLTCMRHQSGIDNLKSFTDHYKPYFTNSVVDLTDILSGTDQFFFKTDTHLNFDGKLLTSLSILNNLIDNFDAESAKKILSGFRGDAFEFIGDLGGKLTPVAKEIDYKITTNFLKRFHNQVGANDGFTTVCLNKRLLQIGESKRLLIFGDSFAERTLQFLSYYYSEILFCRTRYFHQEIVDMFQPDHLITESAERYFSNVRTDDLAPRFFLIYGVRGYRYSENIDFYNAFNAVLNYGSIQHNKFIHNFLNSY